MGKYEADGARAAHAFRAVRVAAEHWSTSLPARHRHSCLRIWRCARCDFASFTDAPLRYEHTRSYGKRDASPHYLLGSRPPEIRQCVTAPDASGGRWRVLRFGPGNLRGRLGLAQRPH